MLKQVPTAKSPAVRGNIVAFPASARTAGAEASSAMLPDRLARPRPVLSNLPPARTDAGPLPALLPVAALTHDARTALTTLSMIAGLLAEAGVLADPHRHYTADLEAVAASLGSLIERIASIHTIVNVPKSAEQAAAPARSAGLAVESCAGVLNAVAGRNVQVHVSAEPNLPPLLLGDDALQRVLINLVKNAAEAMPKGGTVRVTARRALSRSAPAVLVHVSDDGPGIPAFALPRIFDPGFTSKQPCRPGAEPCGLGLAIVRELVEAVGGSIEVASTRRRGTTFELRLPTPTKQEKTSLP